MSTWISKLLILSLSAVVLVGCEETNSLPFAADFGNLGFKTESRKITELKLAKGDVVLTAPNGYCIDRSATRHSGGSGFALLARCDTLGVAGYYDAFDLALITVTTAPLAAGAPAPTVKTLGQSSAPAKVLEHHSFKGLSVVRLESGPHSIEGVSAEHWRAAFTLNGHLIGLALYAPNASPALRQDGMALLRDLTDRTRRASTKPPAAVQKSGKKPAN